MAANDPKPFSDGYWRPGPTLAPDEFQKQSEGVKGKRKGPGLLSGEVEKVPYSKRGTGVSPLDAEIEKAGGELQSAKGAYDMAALGGGGGVSRGLLKQRQELQDNVRGILDDRRQMVMDEARRTDELLEADERRMASFGMATQKIQSDYDEEIQAIDQQHAMRDFVAQHPNAREADLEIAYRKLNDPSTPDQERARIQVALEKSREVNPYRMLQTPGGMLAAVAGIIAGGLARQKDPAALIDKALQNDFMLQKQRVAQRKEQVAKLMQKRGATQEEMQMALQREEASLDIYQRRTSLALKRVAAGAKSQEGMILINEAANQFETELNGKRITQQQRAAARAQQRKILAEEQNVRGKAAEFEALRKQKELEVPMGTSFLSVAPGKKPTADDIKNVKQSAKAYDTTIRLTSDIEDKLKKWEESGVMPVNLKRDLDASVAMLNTVEGKKLLGALTGADYGQLDKMALPKLKGFVWDALRRSPQQLRDGLRRMRRSAEIDLTTTADGAGYRLPEERDYGEEGQEAPEAIGGN